MVRCASGIDEDFLVWSDLGTHCDVIVWSSGVVVCVPLTDYDVLLCCACAVGSGFGV